MPVHGSKGTAMCAQGPLGGPGSSAQLAERSCKLWFVVLQVPAHPRRRQPLCPPNRLCAHCGPHRWQGGWCAVGAGCFAQHGPHFVGPPPLMEPLQHAWFPRRASWLPAHTTPPLPHSSPPHCKQVVHIDKPYGDSPPKVPTMNVNYHRCVPPAQPMPAHPSSWLMPHYTLASVHR